jgi:hypothetical protein
VCHYIFVVSVKYCTLHMYCRYLATWLSLPHKRVVDPDSQGSTLIWAAVSGSRRAKIIHKNEKKISVF